MLLMNACRSADEINGPILTNIVQWLYLEANGALALGEGAE